MRNFKVLMIAFVLVSMMMAGCAPQPPEDDMEPNVSVEPEDDLEEDQQAQTVQVTEDEWSLELSPGTVEAGEIEFDISNEGDFYHEIAIRGNGVDEMLEGGIDAGNTESMTVELEPGTYTVYCPIPNHEQRGMVAELVVQ